MARGKTYIVPHRRRREKKTDYRARLEMIKSGEARFVVRKSLNNIICQIIKFDEKGDRVLVHTDSKELKKYGWKVNSGNIPAAYLTGLLCGLRAKKKKIKSAVFDMGLYRSTPMSRLYAALKGAVDAGMSIPHSDDVLPDDERVAGGHIASYASRLKKDNASAYKKRFSLYIKAGVGPEEITKLFGSVKEKKKKNI